MALFENDEIDVICSSDNAGEYIETALADYVISDYLEKYPNIGKKSETIIHTIKNINTEGIVYCTNVIWPFLPSQKDERANKPYSRKKTNAIVLPIDLFVDSIGGVKIITHENDIVIESELTELEKKEPRRLFLYGRINFDTNEETIITQQVIKYIEKVNFSCCNIKDVVIHGTFDSKETFLYSVEVFKKIFNNSTINFNYRCKIIKPNGDKTHLCSCDMLADINFWELGIDLSFASYPTNCMY